MRQDESSCNNKLGELEYQWPTKKVKIIQMWIRIWFGFARMLGYALGKIFKSRPERSMYTIYARENRNRM